jgi:hypothetical protein
VPFLRDCAAIASAVRYAVEFDPTNWLSASDWFAVPIRVASSPSSRLVAVGEIVVSLSLGGTVGLVGMVVSFLSDDAMSAWEIGKHGVPVTNAADMVVVLRLATTDTAERVREAN